MHNNSLPRTSVGRALRTLAFTAAAGLTTGSPALSQNLGDVVDAGLDFRKPHQTLFAASRLTAFDAATGRGTLQWDRYTQQPSANFNKIDLGFSRAAASEFPGTEYDRDPALPFEISFVTPRTLRLRFSTRDLPAAAIAAEPSLMLAGPVAHDTSWRVQAGDSAITYTSAYGRVRIARNPWGISLHDARGKLLTRTQRPGEPRSFTPFVPFSFLRRSRDLGRSTAATFELAPVVFLGEPKELLSEYTAVTGRSPVPPLWSFGLWMSRITYKSETEVRDVAAKLRQYRIPADVLHLDTGWFETDWRSDYAFSKSRFTDPAAMIKDLRRDGFHVSLWQYTYFTPKNPLSRELAEQGLAVRDAAGRPTADDAVVDFSNPAAVSWYRAKLGPLLDMGVGAIKADFGEGAPVEGLYHSGRTGWYEHNLYPVRYNKAVFDLTREKSGEGIIWARSAWAGSQRYPIHWGGDAENTNSAMAASLRAGLSFGMSGFTYWSHDVGGFVTRAPRELYRRWLPFGVLTSHTRTHGAPPREPWEYDAAFVDDFRRAVELKYTLMPYIYAQAQIASARGWPMLRTLFFEYPDDPSSWLVEDEYLFGSSLLVAPLFEETTSRRAYLPPGSWVDYQTGRTYEGARWHDIAPGVIPIVLLVKNHTVLPRLAVAQSTSAMNWHDMELRVFSSDGGPAEGSVALPGGQVQPVRVEGSRLAGPPLAGQVKWRITR